VDPGLPPRRTETSQGRPSDTQASASRISLDLMALPGLSPLLRTPLFPLGLQVLTLGVLIALVVNGWGHGLDLDGDQLETFRKTNLTTLAVWGLWWPGMILLVLLAGRAWCTVCPMELVARVSHRISRSVWPGLPLPRWARAAWPALGLYLLLQAMVAAASIHRLPHLTSLMLLALPLLAALAGLLLRHPRAFCVALCPAAPLLSVYGRHGLLQLDRRSDATCEQCEGRDCVGADARDRLDRRSCPSLIRPFARAPSDGCVLCFQCAKICPHDNIGYGLPAPESTLRQAVPLRPVELAFVAVITGFVTYEVAGEAPAFAAWFRLIPEQLALLPAPIPLRSWQAIWYLLLFPAALWGIAAAGACLLLRGTPLRRSLPAMLTGAAAVVAGAHAAKAMAKLGSWASYLGLSLSDPAGQATLAALEAGTLTKPARLLGMGPTAALALLLTGLLLLRAMPRRTVAGSGSVAGARFGAAITLFLFVPIIFSWMFAS
jgi:polyferredoxin